ncbi:MAG: glycosyltransferase, partial [Clostridiales bacterium]|nr:glycosyltransferase [Clostridiales bacterium]
MITVEFPPTPGGIGSYVYNLSKKLIQKGNQVTVITRGSLKQKRLETDGIEIFELPFLPIYPLHVWLHGMYVKRLVKQLESNFNLIHVHSPIACSISSSLPVLTTVHTNSKVDA